MGQENFVREIRFGISGLGGFWDVLFGGRGLDRSEAGPFEGGRNSREANFARLLHIWVTSGLPTIKA